MAKWTAPRDPEENGPPPGPVRFGPRRRNHTPPHVVIFAGMEWLSGQIEELTGQLEALQQEMAEMKRLAEENTSPSENGAGQTVKVR
jgi:hypothetical protein